MEQALSAAPAMIKGMKDLLSRSELKGWEPAFAAIETQLTAYNAKIKDQILPKARADHRLPVEVYADNLHQFKRRYRAEGADCEGFDVVCRNP